MSSGNSTIVGTLDLVESNPDTAPVGVIRYARRGGQVIVSQEGTPFVPFGWQRVDVSANAQDVDFTINGEAVHGVEIVGWVPNNNASASTLTIQPNAVSTNQSSQQSGAATNTPDGSQVASLIVAFGAATQGFTSFHVRFFTKTGTPRFYFAQYLYMANSLAVTGMENIAGRWTDTSTAITSIRLHSDRSDGIKAGSYFLWRAMTQAG